MNRILKFEELFPEDYQRPINIWESSLMNAVDKDINNIIYEECGISLTVNYIVETLVKQLNECIENGEYEPYDGFINSIMFIKDDVIDKSKKFELCQVFNIKNFVFDIDCIIMNYTNISGDDMDMISTLNVIAQTTPMSSNRFKIMCYIPALNFHISDVGISVLNHEIMHAWQYHKKNNNKTERQYPNWMHIYRNAVYAINDDNYTDNVKLVAKAIYAADRRELAAFTQQAYFDLKSLDDYIQIDRRLRTTDLYKNMINLYKGMKYLEDNDIPDEILKNCNIPKKKLLFIFKKRYDEYRNNTGRVVMARKYMVRENNQYFDTDDRTMMMLQPCSVFKGRKINKK